MCEREHAAALSNVITPPEPRIAATCLRRCQADTKRTHSRSPALLRSDLRRMMAIAGTKESWDNGGLIFGQPHVGGDAEQVEEVWDDRAILKAFDDALNTHTRKHVDGVEEGGAKSSTAKTRAPSARSASPPPATLGLPAASSSTKAAAPGATTGARYREHHHQDQSRNQGFKAANGRFAAVLAKGNSEASPAGAGRKGESRAMPAGIPGPWEPVTGSSRGVPQDYVGGQRSDYARPGFDELNSRGSENITGAHTHPYPPQSAPEYPPPPFPAGGAAANLEEAGGVRHGLTPPPPPLHTGMGPHAAAFQSLDGVPDDDLADLLLAWYYSGYYTGRYRALQEARQPRTFRRNYCPPPGWPTADHSNNEVGAPPPPS